MPSFLDPPAEIIRHIRLDGTDARCELRLADTLRTTTDNRTRLAYEFTVDGAILFTGDDFIASPVHAIDSDRTLASLLTFLTLRPRSVPASYFADYDTAQAAWAESSDCEALSALLAIYEDGDCPPPWEDLDDWAGTFEYAIEIRKER